VSPPGDIIMPRQGAVARTVEAAARRGSREHHMENEIRYHEYRLLLSMTPK
jgi:hypothetical protein